MFSDVDVEMKFINLEWGYWMLSGVRNEMVYTFNLLNRNNPDMNFDIAEIDESPSGTNFDFTLHIGDVNLTATDVTGFELATVDHVLELGDVRWAMNSTYTDQFVVRFYVSTLN